MAARRRKTSHKARRTHKGRRKSVRDLVRKFERYERVGGAVMAVSGSPGRRKKRKTTRKTKRKATRKAKHKGRRSTKQRGRRYR